MGDHPASVNALVARLSPRFSTFVMFIAVERRFILGSIPGRLRFGVLPNDGLREVVERISDGIMPETISEDQCWRTGRSIPANPFFSFTRVNGKTRSDRAEHYLGSTELLRTFFGHLFPLIESRESRALQGTSVSKTWPELPNHNTFLPPPDLERRALSGWLTSERCRESGTSFPCIS